MEKQGLQGTAYADDNTGCAWTYFSLETTNAPNSGEKCSVIKYLLYLLILFPSISLPNECLISCRCPAPNLTTFTHIHIMYQEVTGRVRIGKGKQGPLWELHGTALSCMLNAEVDWSGLISQGSKRLCGSDGEEDENLHHRRDPRVACGGRCSKLTLRSAEWEATPPPMTACSVTGWSSRDSGRVSAWLLCRFLGHSISLVSYRVFIRMLSVLEIGSF